MLGKIEGKRSRGWQRMRWSDSVMYSMDMNLSKLQARRVAWAAFLLMDGAVENAGLKLNIQKTKIMASGPITSWQMEEKTMQTVTDFIFLGSKITADGDCSHEIKRRLLLGRKVMTNLDSISKAETLLCRLRSI